MAVGEFFVVHAQKVQNGGMEVVDVAFVDGGFVADLVGLTVAHAAFHAAAGHPIGERVRVVIATRFLRLLRHGQAAEFAAPNDKRFVQ